MRTAHTLAQGNSQPIISNAISSDEVADSNTEAANEFLHTPSSLSNPSVQRSEGECQKITDVDSKGCCECQLHGIKSRPYPFLRERLKWNYNCLYVNVTLNSIIY